MAKIENKKISCDEILEILGLFKYDLSDATYDRLRGRILADEVNIKDFELAVSSQNEKMIIQFFSTII